jgi:hypothetical protein
MQQRGIATRRLAIPHALHGASFARTPGHIFQFLKKVDRERINQIEALSMLGQTGVNTPMLAKAQ